MGYATRISGSLNDHNGLIHLNLDIGPNIFWINVEHFLGGGFKFFLKIFTPKQTLKMINWVETQPPPTSTFLKGFQLNPKGWWIDTL